jgi:single-stranded-DNA-specific exonuclease
MQKRWLVKAPVERDRVDAFREEIKADRITTELLISRGIFNYDDAREFFNPDLANLHDPFLMKNMEAAVKRLVHALEKEEKVLLFGDYDVDGTTAVALMYAYLRKFHEPLDYYIPDRYSEGYGISQKGIDFAHQNGFSLIIALDCGIRSIELVEYAKNSGIDFIICDHHQPGESVPDCIVLDPKQKECNYPYKELSGCGVGFKLLQGLTMRLEKPEDELFSYLDLLAISIGADIVDITGENRILAHWGLKKLNAHPRAAFRELLKLANREFPVSLTDVVFTIAPRINAAGRLRSGRFAVDLMISENLQEINQIAGEIDTDNKNRREIDQQITEEAIEMLEKGASLVGSSSIVVYKEDWHKGVVGIVASRLMERYFKPTIVLTSSNGMVTGSARTVNDFDIHGAIHQCSDLLHQFGGHRHAAGLTMHPENLTSFIESFENVVGESIHPDDQSPEIKIDLEMQFHDLYTRGEAVNKIPRVKRNLLRFEPHGPGNMQPVFLSKNIYAADFRVLKEKHLKLKLVDPLSEIYLDAIAFNLADKIDDIAAGLPFDIVFTLEINKWKDRETIQLNVRDIRSSV